MSRSTDLDPPAGRPVSTLQRASLADQVGRHLLAMIREQGLAPGDQLPSEAALADQFQVSRPVIREALTHLKSLGIIGTHSGKPAVVQQVDGRLPAIFFAYALSLKGVEPVDLLEVRRGLEVQSAALAADRVAPSELRRLEGLTRRMKRHLEQQEIEGFVELDVQFHLLIARASRNPLLVHLIEAIREPLRESVMVGLSSRRSAAEVQHVHHLHAQVVAAIAAHDAGAASLAMAEHFDRALVAIQRRDAEAER
jgi:GntR family transcriptional regulator, transcriptional repressor for pyruvate dehydrogenase complex